eukprot:TRINITY_DN511_c0_g1_i1.p2 TRINITY_DN511_c0_g1~~TRINITY_DN511_c0_g1_i1.p2  ORF type:complete len:582 (+),score=200.68 TRINITY_DN511_c0_g1_i1:92-1747(+)
MLAVALASAAAHAALVQMEGGPAALPQGWSSQGPAPRDARLSLSVAVRQSNVTALTAALMRVSDPRSPAYGRHLTNQQVHDLVAPAPAHISAVMGWLQSSGASPQPATPNGDIITAEVTVEQAEFLLSARYETLQHASGVTVLRAPSGYHLPAELAAAVDFVAPTVRVPGVAKKPTAQQTAAGRTAQAEGSLYNTPVNLRELYSVGDAVGKAAGNKQAVTAFLGQYYSATDLQQYWRAYCKGLTCGKGLPKLVGDATTGAAGVEAMLDIETITGVAGNIESEFWGFGGRSPDNTENEPFMKWLTQVSRTSDADVPRIFSTSYGEDEGSWSYPAAQRLNVEFQKAGARGISLLYAAGDDGANCQGGRYVPDGPSSSPYVTAVGGTRQGSGYPKPGSESAVGLSSGGFSNYWAMPDYQKDAVAAYLRQSGLPSQSQRGYNTTSRAYPDIAAQATLFCVTPFGCANTGTSCASPTAAAVISLLNDLRMQGGKPSLGFLNPFIYQNAAAFNDITTGASSGCSSSAGWPAKPGWDAVTGVGTPNYAKLAKAVSALP